MKKRSKWLLMVGALLVAVSLILIIGTEWFHSYTAKQAAHIARHIEAMLPPRTIGVQEDYRVMQMPALSVEGEDFVGLLEIPAYGVQLPIHDQWQPLQLSHYPGRFWGTVYDASLIIGGGSRQLACLREIQNGDTVCVTDMQGAVFSYTVTRIRRADHADSETLQSGNAHLTLFARDTRNMEYIIVECE